MQSKETTGRNRLATGIVELQCEPWYPQLMGEGAVNISSSFRSRLCNGEAIRRPWYYQSNVYTSAHIVKVAVAIYSEVPASYAILGALAPAVTL